MRVEDEYFDVLQNLEFAIVQEFQRDSGLLDLDARAAVNALIRHYEAEAERRQVNTPLGERARRVFNQVKAICEWRLGRAGENLPGAPLAAAELVRCLKRIRQSIDLWNKEFGRQGYLEFVSQYVG